MTEKDGGQARVVNVKSGDTYDVYIGRPSKWGNPFRVGKHGSRDQCIELYRRWLGTRPDIVAQLGELKGKILGCYCKPQPCHGDVLVALLQQKEKNND